MISCFGVGRRGRFSLKSAGVVSVVFAGLAIGGCSADVTRFDSASFNLNDPPDAQPVPSEPVRTSALNDSQVIGSQPRGPYGAGASSVQVASLPDAGYSNQPPPSYSAPSYARPQYTPPPAPPSSYQAKPFGRPRHDASSGGHAALAQAPLGKGEQIEVHQGDTLYGLSRRHHVPVSEMMAVNSLSNPNLHLGQKLYLPTEGSASTRESVAAATAVESARPAPVPLASAAPNVVAQYGATYTVRPGDSLYGIARAHNVKFAELQQVNGITDPRRVKPGVVLRVPGRGGNDTPAVASAPRSAPSVATNTPSAVVPPVAAAEPPAELPNYGQSITTRPTIINGEHRVASLTDKTNDATPNAAPAAASSEVAPPPAAQPPKPEEKVALAAPAAASAVAATVKLRWPTTGRIIAGFGGRPDGTHNDGINLAVPLGTEVHAAESGVVAYAGNELKGYGNLVLLRHDNGWVTAYAHNDELLVKRGDKVKRGQVIAKAGKTGSVDQPQLHFELRQGSRPVDPIPYLEKL
jgi:murein DD-endopeptidase MepM/ murein hydrolase activator NlpD